MTIQLLLQALANGEPLPEGVTLPEGFEIAPQLLQRLAAGALGQANAQGASGPAGAAARPLPAPGMSASVTILTELREQAVLVPTSAVRQLDGAWFVTIPATDDGDGSGIAFERITVEVGGSDGTNVEITSGLEAGAVLLIGADSAGVAFSATQQQQQQLPQLLAFGFSGGGGGLGGGRQ